MNQETEMLRHAIAKEIQNLEVTFFFLISSLSDDFFLPHCRNICLHH